MAWHFVLLYGGKEGLGFLSDDFKREYWSGFLNSNLLRDVANICEDTSSTFVSYMWHLLLVIACWSGSCSSHLPKRFILQFSHISFQLVRIDLDLYRNLGHYCYLLSEWTFRWTSSIYNLFEALLKLSLPEPHYSVWVLERPRLFSFFTSSKIVSDLFLLLIQSTDFYYCIHNIFFLFGVLFLSIA